MKQYIERSELVSRIYKYVELTNPEEQEWVKDECIRQAHAMPSVNVGEWISVDERLPEDDLPKDTERRTIRCLVATNKGSVKACVRQRYILASTGELSPWCWSRDMFATPTYWMPLPEPPNTKGGAE